MSEAGERTEQPTARRLRKAREDGQVPRSAEAAAAAGVVGGLLVLLLAGGWMARALAARFASGLGFDRQLLASPALLPGVLGAQLAAAFAAVLPLLLACALAAVLGSLLGGGVLFEPKLAAPRADKLDPVAGLRRMFGTHALSEVGKALLKVLLVGGALWFTLGARLPELSRTAGMALEPALALAGRSLAEAALAVALGLVLVALLDLPWQRHQLLRRLRMTRQEIKDELKDSEGRPEVKAQIRRRQREMAQARMMQRVKDADVVITNPEHFAVALDYDPTGDGAPVLVAKGSDHLAARIREEAGHHGIHLFAAPELARALYFTTEPGHPVPEGLYHAVAQVIAYVYSLEGNHPAYAGMERPRPVVPAALRFDADGQPLAPA